MRARTAAWVFAVLTGALVGAPPAEALGASSGGDSQASRGPAPSKATNEITLVDAGRSPTSPLRMELVAGTEVRATIEVRRSSQPTIDGIPGTHATLPPVRVTASTTVDSVTARGDASLVTTYENIVVVDDGTITAAAREQLEMLLAPLEDVVLTMTVSSRNEPKATKITGTESLDSATAQLLSRFTEQLGRLPVPFPREPVGAGARWQLRSRALVAGLAVEQTYDYSLREVAGTRVVVDVDYVHTAPRQRAPAPPGLETATRVDVTKYRVVGQAAVTIDLEEPMPLQTSAHVTGVEVLRVRDGDAPSARAEKLVVDVLLVRITGDG